MKLDDLNSEQMQQLKQNIFAWRMDEKCEGVRRRQAMNEQLSNMKTLIEAR